MPCLIYSFALLTSSPHLISLSIPLTLSFVEFIYKETSRHQTQDHSMPTGLMNATSANDVFAVNQLLSMHVDVDEIYNQKTALVYAIQVHTKLNEPDRQKRNACIIRCLLEARANPYIGIPFVCAAHIKSSPDSLEITQYLLDVAPTWLGMGTNGLLRQRDKYGQTALIWSIAANNFLLASLLLKSHADVNDSDRANNSPLIHAAKKNCSLEIIHLLLEAKAHVNSVSSSGRTALYYAKKEKNVKLYTLLIDRNAQIDPDIPDTPAAFEQAVSVKNRLTSNSPNPKVDPQLIHYVLVHAIKRGSLPEVTALLETSHINVLGPDGKTALIHAIERHYQACTAEESHQNMAIVTALLDAKANPHLSTALFSAIQIPSSSIAMHAVHALIRGSENLEPMLGVQCLFQKRNAEESTPLICAVTQQYLHIVALLLKENAEVNDRDRKKNSPLICAAKLQSSPEMIDCLINARADVNACNVSGKSAYFYAKKHRQVHLLEVLKRLGASTVYFSTRGKAQIIEARFQSSAVDAIAKTLLNSVQKVKAPGYNPFKADLQDALEKAKTLTKEVDVHSIAVNCLLKIIEERYASIQETFTKEQIEDVIAQQTRLQGVPLTAENYDYFEYDSYSLECAISAYYLNERMGSAEAIQKYAYKVLRHRMPGYGCTDVDYQRLYRTVQALLPKQTTSKR